MNRRGAVLLAAVLALTALGPALAATPPAVQDAWKNVATFHEDLARIDRARDLLEADVAREPSLDALLLLSWAHLLWADYRAPSVEAKLASYERGREIGRASCRERGSERG